MSLGLALAVGGLAQAQFRFADLMTSKVANHAAKEMSFEIATDHADLKHGTLLSLSLNEGAKVRAHLIYFDQNNNRLFVRKNSGGKPEAYGEKDLERIEIATRLVVNQKEDGQRQNVVEPEIFKQVCYNGGLASVVYTSNALSQDERDVLAQLQRAENDLMALTYQKAQQDDANAQEKLLQQEQLRTQRLINTVVKNELTVNFPHPPRVPLLTYGSSFDLLQFVRPFVTAKDRGQPIDAQTLRLMNNVMENELTVNFRHPPRVPLLTYGSCFYGGCFDQFSYVHPPVFVRDRSQPIDPQMLLKAKDMLDQIRRLAVYEDGRLVAVRLPVVQ
jgi:hypothetical protein